MRFIDLFAGIGGARRAMELSGHKCVGFVERDKFAIASYTSMHLITDEQREYLATLTLKQRQKEILKSEYRNGEWFHDDITTLNASDIPKAECWCFGAPCQSFSIAGKRAGLRGESGLIQEVFRLLDETREEDRPEWIIYENVKGMLSSNRGMDFFAILSEMDRGGYDVQWQLLNSKYHGVPQNRERVYTVGHLRRYGSREIFPIQRANGENCSNIKIIGHRANYRRNMQVFDSTGITEALDTCAGGGRGHHVAIKTFGGVRPTKEGRGADRERIIDPSGIATALTATMYKEPPKVGITVPNVVIPVITPDRSNKRQNGRRFKENGDVAFTLTAQDRHGVAIGTDSDCLDSVWYEKEQCNIYIRKLTPKECFRLQGWSDEYFEKAEFVNSDSQLYKQAGNGITVPVMQEIARRIE